MNSRPSKELQQALENLDALASLNGTPLRGSVPCLKVQEGRILCAQQWGFKKIIKRAFAFLAALFPVLPSTCKDELYQTLLKSCEIVKKNAAFLNLWEGGNAEQRRFAAYAKETIGRFNQYVESTQAAPFATSRLFRFFYGHQGQIGKKLTKIDIQSNTPLNIYISPLSSTQYDPLKMLAKFAVKAPEILTKKVAQLRETFLPVQAKELFIMKAISLLEKNGIASHEEARQLVRLGSIQTSFDAQEGIHTLSLALKPYCGRVIEIQGAFMGRIPLPDRFQISLCTCEPGLS